MNRHALYSFYLSSCYALKAHPELPLKASRWHLVWLGKKIMLLNHWTGRPDYCLFAHVHAGKFLPKVMENCSGLGWASLELQHIGIELKESSRSSQENCTSAFSLSVQITSVSFNPFVSPIGRRTSIGKVPLQFLDQATKDIPYSFTFKISQV